MTPWKSLLILAMLLLPWMSAQSTDTSILATPPEATPLEKEIISALQINSAGLEPIGNVSISLYNPTKYKLTSCVVRVQIPSRKIDRVYFSDKSAIPSFQDGKFTVPTKIHDTFSKDFKCEIIKISYEKPKS